jgi:hypothetical protein
LRSVAYLVTAVLLSAFLPVCAQGQHAGLPTIPLDWFNEPEAHHKHWKVQLGSVTSSYSQRLVIRTSGIFKVRNKDGPPPNLHLVLRVADEQGKWFDGSDYSHLDFATVPPKTEAVEWHANIFVQPGTYQVVLLAYDAAAKQHYVWRNTVKVDRPHVLPDLDRTLPMVEFYNAGKPHVPLGEHLPIQNQRPLRIDIVLNLTGDLQMSVTPGRWRAFRQITVESALMGAVSALSQLRPATGCVHVSAIDIVHLEMIRDRAVADPQLDWLKVRQALLKNRDQTTVDVRTLDGRNKARIFFRQFLEGVISDNTGCGPDLTKTDRAVIVVSDSLMFPPGTDNESISFPQPSGSRFFHVQIRLNGIAVFDQVGHMLQSLHPRHFGIDDPGDLRKALAGIISDLEKVDAQSQVQ